MNRKDEGGDDDTSHRTHRVTCKTTAGEVLWTKDMTGRIRRVARHALVVLPAKREMMP